MSDLIFTVAQTAEYLQVCDKTVRRLIMERHLVASRVGMRSWRIKKSDIDEYLISNTNEKEGGTTDE